MDDAITELIEYCRELDDDDTAKREPFLAVIEDRPLEGDMDLVAETLALLCPVPEGWDLKNKEQRDIIVPMMFWMKGAFHVGLVLGEWLNSGAINNANKNND